MLCGVTTGLTNLSYGVAVVGILIGGAIVYSSTTSNPQNKQSAGSQSASEN